MKKTRILLLCALLLISCLPQPVEAAGIELGTYSYILIEYQTKTILCEQRARERMYPASLTKIMTMLLVMEAVEAGTLSMSDQVTITAEAAELEGTRMFLEAGEVRTIEELMYGTAVESGNDSATALGIHLAGSLPAFAEMMNRRAAALGLTDTNFVNACGLHDPMHYTTAYDLAMMSAELLTHENINKFISTWMIDVYVGRNNDVLRTLASSNKLLRQTDYVDGIKTGFTEEAGHCIAVSGEKNGMRLIGVLLRCGTSANRLKDAEALLNYGFANYELLTPVKRGMKLETIDVYNGTRDEVGLIVNEEYSVLTDKQSGKAAEAKITLDKQVLYAPVEMNEQVGSVHIYINGEEVSSLPLYTAEAIPRCSLAQYFSRVRSLLLL